MPNSTTYDGITADTYYHIEPLPGAIEETDAALDRLAEEGWELVETNGRNAIFKSRVLSYAGTADAFGRDRVSIPHTLGDYKHIYFIDQSFTDYSVSGSTHTLNKDRASVTLQTSASIGSRAVHQTKMYHNYMPGKSQHIFSSVVFGAAQPGVIKRTGYFDDYNGIFFEQDATGSLNWVVRSATNGTGSVTENRVSQANWNINTLMAGAGPVVLDITKSQLVSIDFQWLGIGRVRCGLVINGEVYLTHVFDHTNKTDVVYMSTPNLPVRCEILNTTTATGSMEQICATVMSEGGYMESGRAFSISNETYRSLASGSTMPVLAIRLKNSINGLDNRAFVRIQEAATFTESQTIRYSLTKLESGSMLTTASAWVSADDDSVIEYNKSATAYTGGKVLLTGFVGANSLNINQANPLVQTHAGVTNKQNFITQNFTSTDSEIYVLTAKNMTANTTNVGGTILWSEIY